MLSETFEALFRGHTISSAMSQTATITIISGPDQGKVFQLNDELVHVGRGPQNQVDLNDPQMNDRQVSIVSRNGRYAIYTPLKQAIEVDGAIIPAERWVWLPAKASIRVSDHTALQFVHVGAQDGSTDREDVGAKEGAEQKSLQSASRAKLRRMGKGRRFATKQDAKKGRQVARFITDQAGDHLVTLGEDGHLPELSLSEGPHRKQVQKANQQTNPALVYGLIAFSFCLSILILFVDAGPGGASSSTKTEARRKVVEYFGDQSGELQSYQHLLREAQRARSRKDPAAEQRAYRQVLQMLNSEDNNSYTGLTGNQRGRTDDQLRKLIATLLSR